MSDIVEARPASTVVLLRDTREGLETLLLKRNKALIFAGGAWVFPGGAVDPEDIEHGGGDLVRASRIAAAREAHEESGLSPRLDDMVLLSHWTTPVGEPRRFSTWIYAAPLAADTEVVIDGGEIHGSQWIGVREAAAQHAAGQLDMLPPTYFTLLSLSHYTTVTQIIATERNSPVPEVFPVFASSGDSGLVMFRGDAGYQSRNCDQEGPRHRAVLRDHVWEYEYVDVDAAYPPLIQPGKVQ